MQQGFNIKKIYIFVFISCFILYLWLATIFGYTSPDIALSGVYVENKFFSIGGFGNSFANFNVNVFGYIAYIYLPLLLLPVYKLHDDSSYSFRKMQLTFAYILLFISCLIIQSIIFNNGLFGNTIIDILSQYIGLFGVALIAFAGIILSFLLISDSISKFIFKYLGGTIQMAMQSFTHILKKIFEKIKTSYTDLNLDYIQRANKKIINQELSEISTTSKTKYIFNEPLIEAPLDEYKHKAGNLSETQEQINAKVQQVSNNQVQDELKTNNETLKNKQTSKQSNIKQTDNNISIQLKEGSTITKENYPQTLPYQQHNDIYQSKISHVPKTQTRIKSTDEDILKKFHQANIHLKFPKTQTLDEQPKTFQIKLSDDRPNPLKVFIKPQSDYQINNTIVDLSNEKQTSSMDISKNNTDSFEITRQVDTQSSNINVIDFGKQDDIDRISPSKDSDMQDNFTIRNKEKHANVSIQIKPNPTIEQPQSITTNNINTNKDGIRATQENQSQTIQIKQNAISIDNIINQDGQKNINNKTSKQDYKKPDYENMPLNSNYKTLKMDFRKINNTKIVNNLDSSNEQDDFTNQMAYECNTPPKEILDTSKDTNSQTSDFQEIDLNINDIVNADIQVTQIYETQDSNNEIIAENTKENNFIQHNTESSKDTYIDLKPIQIQEITESKVDTNTSYITQIDSNMQKQVDSKVDIATNEKQQNLHNNQYDSINIKEIQIPHTQNKHNNIMEYKPYVTNISSLSTNDMNYPNFNANNFTYIEPKTQVQPKYDVQTINVNRQTKLNAGENNTSYKDSEVTINSSSTYTFNANKHEVKNTNQNDIDINETNRDDSKEITMESSNPLTQQQPFILPQLKLLQEPIYQDSIQDSELDIKIQKMLQILNAHKIHGDIIDTLTGPVVTTFEFRPETNVKVSKILSHRNDLALGLKAKSIRIQAPIPGKDVIGIEIPNSQVETIYLREILQSKEFLQSQDSLTIALGKDISGNPIVANLAKLPHLLVAGTTGSGKSVGVNAIILSLLYRNNPDELKLMMIDPKQVEFAPYEDLPHLITPIINAPNKAIKALQAATIEMDKRYEAFSQIKAKNIISYNEKVEDKMPNFVIIIDELADLMITGGKEAEAFIARIAQMGRAAGMHLIIATQRSSVNVVTGHIKANLPSRISYRVGSRVDSKVILDDSGAEELLGNGDGLFTTTNGLIRIHAPWVSEQEVENIVDFIKAQREPKYDDSFLMESKVGISMGDKFVGEGGLLDEAKEVMLKDNKTSISNLQRKLSIGYNKAASLVEALEQEGFLSAPNHKGERTILQ